MSGQSGPALPKRTGGEGIAGPDRGLGGTVPPGRRSGMAPLDLKLQVQHGRAPARGIGFRLLYYAWGFVLAGALVVVLYLGSLLG